MTYICVSAEKFRRAESTRSKYAIFRKVTSIKVLRLHCHMQKTQNFSTTEHSLFTVHGAATCQRKERVMQHGYCVIRHGYCNGYPATKKDQQALRFLFRCGNSVESKSLEFELKPLLATCCLVNDYIIILK